MSIIHNLIFKYDDLKAEGENFEATIPSAMCQEHLGELIGQSGYWVQEDFHTHGTLYKSLTGEVIVDCHIKGQADFMCVSCGQKQTLTWEIREDLIVVPENHQDAQEEDVSGEGELDLMPDVYTFKGNQIDLAPIVCENLVLSAPLHPRCETVKQTCRIIEQEKIPEVFNIDPRWAPLLELQKQFKTEKN